MNYINSIGLLLDIVGATLLYIYVFSLPQKKIVQSSLPGKQYTEMRNGKPSVVVEMGVQVNIRAINENYYHEYKDKLYRLRAKIGFFMVLSGFVLQLASNYTNISSAEWAPTFSICLGLLVLAVAIFVFNYLPDLQPAPEESGRNMKLNVSESKKGFGISIESDPEFNTWSRKLNLCRKRIRISKT
jgi:hypothetical protein